MSTKRIQKIGFLVRVFTLADKQSLIQTRLVPVEFKLIGVYSRHSATSSIPKLLENASRPSLGFLRLAAGGIDGRREVCHVGAALFGLGDATYSLFLYFVDT